MFETDSIDVRSGGRPPTISAWWLECVADPVRLQILRALARVEELTAADLALSVRASSPTLRRHLEALVLGGLVLERAGESDGETPGRPAVRFHLAPRVRGEVVRLLDR